MEGNNKNSTDKTGFSALDNLVSDVDRDISQAHDAEPESPERKLPPESQNESPAKSPSLQSGNLNTDAGGKNFFKNWWWAIGIVVVLIWKASVQDTTRPTPANEQKAVSAPAPVSSPQSETSEGQPITTNLPRTGWLEDMPNPGVDLILTRPQVNYCVAEDARLKVMERYVDSESDFEIARYNRYISSFNARCSQFRYREGALESSRRESKGHLDEYEREALRRIAKWRNAGAARKRPGLTRDSSLGDAAPAGRVPSGNATFAEAFGDLTESKPVPDERVSAGGLATSTQPRGNDENYRMCISGEYAALCKHHLLDEEQRAAVATAERRVNLKLCSSGEYAALCKHNLLTESEKRDVREAERLHNLQVCISGEYAALCKHELLTATEAEQVDAAERRINFQTCISGNTAALCKHHLLTNEQKIAVVAAEKRENYRTCISGSLKALCKHNLLTSDQAVEVAAAEQRATVR